MSLKPWTAARENGECFDLSRIERLSPADGIGTYTVSNDAALTSIAVSLKRIADALASVGRNAERQDHEDGLDPKDEHAVGSVAAETPDV